MMKWMVLPTKSRDAPLPTTAVQLTEDPIATIKFDRNVSRKIVPFSKQQPEEIYSVTRYVNDVPGTILERTVLTYVLLYSRGGGGGKQ